MSRFIDTNVLLYAISDDPAECGKRERARELLDQDDLALSAQVLQEFYWQATRASRPGRISHQDAAALIEAWGRYPVQEISLGVVKAALGICARYGLSYWDSAIIAAAQALGCDQVLSEDMQDGQRFERLTVVNPFR